MTKRLYLVTDGHRMTVIKATDNEIREWFIGLQAKHELDTESVSNVRIMPCPTMTFEEFEVHYLGA